MGGCGLPWHEFEVGTIVSNLAVGHPSSSLTLSLWSSEGKRMERWLPAKVTGKLGIRDLSASLLRGPTSAAGRCCVLPSPPSLSHAAPSAALCSLCLRQPPALGPGAHRPSDRPGAARPGPALTAAVGRGLRRRPRPERRGSGAGGNAAAPGGRRAGHGRARPESAPSGAGPERARAVQGRPRSRPPAGQGRGAAAKPGRVRCSVPGELWRGPRRKELGCCRWPGRALHGDGSAVPHAFSTGLCLTVSQPRLDDVQRSLHRRLALAP